MKRLVVSRSELMAGEDEFELTDIVREGLDFLIGDFLSNEHCKRFAV